MSHDNNEIDGSVSIAAKYVSDTQKNSVGAITSRGEKTPGELFAENAARRAKKSSEKPAPRTR